MCVRERERGISIQRMDGAAGGVLFSGVSLCRASIYEAGSDTIGFGGGGGAGTARRRGWNGMDVRQRWRCQCERCERCGGLRNGRRVLGFGERVVR